MHHLSKQALACNVDLFGRNEAELRAGNRAARKIAERFGLSIHHAAVIARSAGIGEYAR